MNRLFLKVSKHGAVYYLDSDNCEEQCTSTHEHHCMPVISNDLEVDYFLINLLTTEEIIFESFKHAKKSLNGFPSIRFYSNESEITLVFTKDGMQEYARYKHEIDSITLGATD